MKKIKYVFLVILSLLYINVKAEGVCSKDELANLKELANNIEIKKNIHIREENSVVKQEVGLDVYYTIDVLNYNNNLDVRFKMNEEIFSYPISELKNITFLEGKNVSFYIYSFNSNGCLNDLLRTINVKFEYYNLYYYDNKDKCEKYPGFKYCKEYMNTSNEDFSELTKKFEEYISKNTINENESKETTNYLYYIIGGVGVVIVVSLLVVFIIKKRNESKL